LTESGGPSYSWRCWCHFYYAITENPLAQVELVWAVQDIDKAILPVLTVENSVNNKTSVRLFVTGNKAKSTSAVASSSNRFVDDDIELNRLEKDNKCTTSIPVEDYKRPDLARIVDEVFEQGHNDRTFIIIDNKPSNSNKSQV